MISYTCDSCGSNLSHRKDSPFYLCTFCGKIYAEDMTEASLSTVRYLRINGRTREARSLITLLIEKDPDDYRYIWEMLNCSISPAPVSMYLSQRSHNMKLLKSVLENQWYRKLKKILPEDKKGYTDEIEEYIRVCEEISDIEYELDKTKKSQKAYSRDQLEEYVLDSEERNHGAAFAAWFIYGGIFGSLGIGALCERVGMMDRMPLLIGIFLSVHIGLAIGIKATEKTRAYKNKKNAIERMEGEISSNHQLLTDKKRRSDDLIKSIKSTEESVFDLISQ